MSAYDRMEKFIVLKLTTTWTQAKIAKELTKRLDNEMNILNAKRLAERKTNS